MTNKEKKEYLARCENTAEQVRQLREAFMQKGFTSDEAFKLVCLLIPIVALNE